jgi:hypothetical protein
VVTSSADRPFKVSWRPPRATVDFERVKRPVSHRPSAVRTSIKDYCWSF